MQTSETTTGSQSPDIEKTINKALDKARDIGYNTAIDHVLKIVRERELFVHSENYPVSKHRFAASYELNELITKLQALNK